MRSSMRIIPAWAGNAPDRRARRGTRPRYGSSPRGRGTRPCSGADHPRVGNVRQLAGRIIPAWAGNTFAYHGSAGRRRIIPAQAGNTSTTARLNRERAGSSPRGRGTQPRRIATWSFPADHPRAGGEHSRPPLNEVAPGQPGSSPRGRGTPPPDRRPSTAPSPAGSSPRGRGTLVALTALWIACERLDGSSPRGRGTPRKPRSDEPGALCGSSPRGRGTPRRYRLYDRKFRERSDHPRAGGEHSYHNLLT